MANLEFIEPVKVGNLKTAHINHLNLRNLTKRFLYRHTEQNVTALYSFKNIKAGTICFSKYIRCPNISSYCRLLDPLDSNNIFYVFQTTL